MVKAGRSQINVIDSLPYSQLIFFIASGKNYALAISEARGKKDSSPTAKQLKQLEGKGFITSQKEKLLNKTIYSVNWIKILDEFIKLIKEHKNDFLQTAERLKVNISIEQKELINTLDNNSFIENIKSNKYLIYFFKEYFSYISKLTNVSISSALSYFLFFNDFDFYITSNPSLIDFKQWKDLKERFQNIKEQQSEINQEKYINFHERREAKERELNELINKDPDLKNILSFNEIMKVLKSELALQIALNNSTELVAFSILKENFSIKEVNDFLTESFFKLSPRYKDFPNELKDILRDKINKLDLKSL